MTDHRDKNDITDPTENAEPIEKADRNDPTDPIDKADPTEPIDRTEPLLPIDNTDSSDHNDHRELGDFSGSGCNRPAARFMTPSSRNRRG